MSDQPALPDPIFQLRRLCDPAEQEKLQTDAELLAMYLQGGDQRAMETLIHRYAGLVASVCRTTVSDPASAEDAFQATFLILLKSANKIQRRSSLAAWLHGVAYRSACRIRSSGRKQLSNQSIIDVNPPNAPQHDPITELARSMELEALDRELQKLPDRLREPLIEHYLLGFTAPEIADRMELSLSAVEGRLRRGRRALRTSLARRGVSLSVVLAGAAWFDQHVQAAEAADWTARLIETHFSSGECPTHVSSNPEVSSLVHGETTMLPSGILKPIVAGGFLLVAGTLVMLSVHGTERGGSGSGGRSTTLEAQAAKMPELASTVVAQFLGPIPGEPSQASPDELLSIQAEQDQSAQDQSAQDQSAQDQSAQDQSGQGKGIAPAPAEPVEWERPESEGSSEAPVWLMGGAASLSALEQNRSLLAQQVDMDFGNQPLQQVVTHLSDEIGRTAIFDLNQAELELIGLAPDTPVTLRHRGTVRELLRRICQPLELSYVVTESGFEITSRDNADSRPSMRFYDLSYVLPNSANAGALVRAIQTTVHPESWAEVGGTETISIVGSMMIVSARDTAHQEIETLLVNISRMNPKNAAKVVTPSPEPGSWNVLGGSMSGDIGGGMF